MLRALSTMLRLALLRWLDVPPSAAHRALQQQVADHGILWSCLALERRAATMTGDRYVEAAEDLDRALQAFGQRVPLAPEPRRLFAYEETHAPPPRDDGERWALLIGAAYAVALALGLAMLLSSSGCTIRGGADCAGGCPPREVCRGERCVPADMRAVPAPGGPV